MIKKLIELGFSTKQATVYVALIDLRQTTIGPLEKKLGIHKQIIYKVLNELISMNLVNVVIKNGRRHFSAGDFEALIEKNMHQKKLIESLLPDMYARLGKEKNVGDIKIYEGEEAIRAFLYKMLKKTPAKHCISVLGAGGQAFLDLTQKGYFFERYENLRIDKKIEHKLLMYENQRDVSSEYIDRRYVESRFLPEVFHQPIATQIWFDRIALLMFGEKPQIIEIESKQITDSFRNYFEMLWEMGEK